VPETACTSCHGSGLLDGDPCPDCDVVAGAGQPAGELYARDGTPCASCSCSYTSLKPGAGTTLGFEAGAGLVLRVCRVGREPMVAEGGTGTLWCPDYKSFAELVPLAGDDLDSMQRECSRGFLADLAQGQRPIPRDVRDLRWYDRGLREGWLPPHRVELDGAGSGARLHGPWEQFVVVGVTPAWGDGHTPAVAQAVLQARDRRSYLLPPDPDAPEVSGRAQPHAWWVAQVASGAAVPLLAPIGAERGARVLVLRGGERVLAPHSFRYLAAGALEAALDDLAGDALRSAESAARRGNDVVARICALRGLRARPEHPDLRRLAGLAASGSERGA
jgi:hypothetical protein